MPNELRQGDWLTEMPSLSIASVSGEFDDAEVPTPHGVAVVTQCCDLEQNYSGFVHVAPIADLKEAVLADALSGRMTRYALIAENLFADLSLTIPVFRTAADRATLALRMDDLRRRTFASQVSRRFSRFAYPAPLYPVLSPLRDKIRSKAPRDGSIGRVLRQVETLRLECTPSWDAEEGLELTLLVVVKPEFLPTPDTGEWSTSAEYERLDLSAAANRLVALPASAAERNIGWSVFADALLSLLDMGRGKSREGLVTSVDVEVMRTDEFTYERFLRSVDLDLDFLSEPHEL